MAAGKTAVVAGSTGLVGSLLLSMLAAAREFRHVIALARRPLVQPPAKVEQREADFDRLDEILEDLRGEGDRIDVFCCLGTTIRAAGSQLAFRRVDHDYVLALADWAKRIGARRFLAISAVGADARNRIFYNRVKGETEQALQSLPLRSLVLARPSLLVGERAEARPGEKIALVATRPLRSLLPAGIRPVDAGDVAAALLLAARATVPPPILGNAQMHGAARQLAEAR